MKRYLILIVGVGILGMIFSCAPSRHSPMKPLTITSEKTDQDSATSGTRPVYNYQHKVVKTDELKSPGERTGRVLKRRLAVSRFGDITQPADSPFMIFPFGKAGAEEKTKVESKDNQLVLQHEAKQDLGLKTEPCPAFTELLIDALTKSDRFVVVERKEINEILREQDFHQSGRVLPQTAAELREIRGVEYIITGEVSEIQSNNTAKQIVALLRIYDVETGEVVASSLVQADSVIEAVIQAVKNVADAVKSEPWRIKVSDVRPGNDVILNAGKNVGIYENDRFEIISLGRDIIDPDEGTVLDRDKTRQGVVEIFEVHPTYSKGRMLIIKENGRFKAGDLAQYITGPYGDDYTEYIERLSSPDFEDDEQKTKQEN